MKKQTKKNIDIKKLKRNGLNYKQIGAILSIREKTKLRGEELLKSPTPFIEKYPEKSSILSRVFMFIKRLLRIKK